MRTTSPPAPKSRAPQQSQRPFVLIHMAMTADGKIATANRAVTSFGSPRDLAHLYEIRATADAILCGARTVEESHATLGNGPESFTRLRQRRGLTPYPLRVVISGSGSLSPTAELWQKDFSPVVVATTATVSAARLKRLRKLTEHVWTSGPTEVDFPGLLHRLQAGFGIQRLVCEGGSQVNDALLRAGLVDEVHLTWCPLIFGGRTAPTIADGQGFSRLADAAQFELKSKRRVGDELFLVYRVRRSAG